VVQVVKQEESAGRVEERDLVLDTEDVLVYLV